MHQLIIEQFHLRVFQESYPRIFTCLDKLTQTQIWRQPNLSTNSVGNLILHLHGNLRQWVLSGLFEQPDNRKRAQEFVQDKELTSADLKTLLTQLQQEIETAFQQRQPELSGLRKVQVFEESGVSILFHVTEHFSYHTGQIALLTKLMIDEDLKFYGDLDLEVN